MSFSNAFMEIFRTFFTFGLRAKKTRLFLVLGLIPAAILLTVRVLNLFGAGPASDTLDYMGRFVMMFYFQLLLPMGAIFFGSSVLGDELEQKTLVYLITRPVPRQAVLLGKSAANLGAAATVLGGGMAAALLIAAIPPAPSDIDMTAVLRYTTVGILALAAYFSLFVLLGSFMRRATMIGLFFVLGWENLVQYLPGSTQKLTIIHYVKSLLPQLPGDNQFLIFRLEPSGAGESLTVLFLLIALLLGGAAWIFRRREYVLSDSL